jgi:hypothetical protein
MEVETVIVLVEGLMVFGGLLAFALWQLRDLRRYKPLDDAARQQREEARRLTRQALDKARNPPP